MKIFGIPSKLPLVRLKEELFIEAEKHGVAFAPIEQDSQLSPPYMLLEFSEDEKYICYWSLSDSDRRIDTQFPRYVTLVLLIRTFPL